MVEAPLEGIQKKAARRPGRPITLLDSGTLRTGRPEPYVRPAVRPIVAPREERVDIYIYGTRVYEIAYNQ